MRHKLYVMGLIVFSLIVSATGSPHPARSQQDETPRPQVIDVYPPTGEEMLGSEPLIVTFDQPMDQASVKRTLTITPFLAFTLAWSDAQTLTITPTRGWQRGQHYTLTIQHSARAQTGLEMSDRFTFKVLAQSDLQVTQAFPSADTKATTTAKISVSFNHPVVALGTDEQSGLIKFSPDIPGKGEWITTSLYVFTPSSPLVSDTHYVGSISRGLMAVDGATLQAEYNWSFQTPAASAIQVGFDTLEDREQNNGQPTSDLQQTLLDQPILVYLTDSVNLKVMKAHTTLRDSAGHYTKVDLTWDSIAKLITIKHDRLKLNTDYQLHIDALASGGAIDAPIDLSFHTVSSPMVTDSYPSNGDDNAGTYSQLDIYFNTLMDFPADAEKYVTIDPPVSMDRGSETGASQSYQLYLRPNWAEKTAYTVTLKAGLKDIYGNVIAKDYVIHFTTGKQDSGVPEKPPFEVLLNGDMMITSAHRGGTTIPIRVNDNTPIPMGLYRLDPQQMGDVTLVNHQLGDQDSYIAISDYPPQTLTVNYLRCQVPPTANANNRLRQWTYTFDKDHPSVNLSADGKDLPVGLYWVTMGQEHECKEGEGDYPQPDWKTYKGPLAQFALAVVTSNLTIKRGADSIFVWMTRLDDTTPVAGAIVTIYDGTKVVGSATTDQQGAVTIPLHLLDSRFVMITAQSKDDFGAWFNNYQNAWRIAPGDMTDDYGDGGYMADPPNSQGYVYTDRAVYRPGDKVKFRGVMRLKRDMTFPVPSQRTIYYRVGAGYAYQDFIDNYEQPIYKEGELTLSDFGTFDGEYDIPPDAKPDGLYIQVSMDKSFKDSGYYYFSGEADPFAGFIVADYRPSNIAVEVTTPSKPLFYGDTLSTTVRASYYSGEPYTNATIDWKTTYNPGTFNYAGTGNYLFGNNGWDSADDYYDYYDYWGSGISLDKGQVQADAAGTAVVSSHQTTRESGKKPLPISITFEGTTNDDQGRPVSARSTVTIYPSNLFIGADTGNSVLVKDIPSTLHLITVNADSKPVANQVLSVTIRGFEWDTANWGNFTKLAVQSVTTGSDGKADFSFTPPYDGVFDFLIEGKDQQGRASQSGFTLWAYGSTPAWINSSGSDLPQIRAAKTSYRPGDTAELLIPSPFAGSSTALITTERTDVISYEVVKLDGAALRYKLPITDAFAPNVFVHVVFIAAPTKDTPYPQYKLAPPIELTVEPVKQQLNVSLKASTLTAKPGQTVMFTLKVTDSDGNPAHAEVGLALVDKAVLDLVPSGQMTLLDAFYNPQPRYIYTDLSIDGLVESKFSTATTGYPGFGGGGTPQAPGSGLRQNFETTPLWLPHVITDAEGTVSVSVTLPDNLTTWHLDARALTADLKVGQAELNITSSLPLLIQPVTPRFLVAGDVVRLAAVIRNNTAQDSHVEATLQASGLDLSTLPTQHIMVPAYGRVRVEWGATVQDVKGVNLTFTARGDNGLQDAAKPDFATGPDNTLPVYRYEVPSASMVTSGILRTAGTRTETVVLPSRLRNLSGDLTVRIDPSLASALTDSFTYLRQYPYYCIEQTVSTFLPNLATLSALGQLNVDHAGLSDELKPQIDAAMQKLANEQKDDGSWGWYPNMETDPLTSAYATLGLIEAKHAGFPVDDTMLHKAIDYVQKQLQTMATTGAWQPSRRAFYLYVLARNGIGDYKQYQALYNMRAGLTLAGRSYLLMAYHERFPQDNAVKTLISDLISTAQYSSNGVHWEEGFEDWWNWGTDTRTTALALTALIRTTPNNDVIPDVVRWLMSVRQLDHWATTQETTWSIIGLSEWMALTGELQGNYQYTVNLNRKQVESGTVSPGTVRDVKTLTLDVHQYLTNRLTISRADGTGALYYQAHFNLQIPASEVSAESQGISIKREYFVGSSLHNTTTHVRVGDTVIVRLTISTTQPIQYFALEDAYPAGFEPLDKTLETTSLGVQAPGLVEINRDDTHWYWGWWYFKQAEIRDAQIDLYSDYLPAGTYVYSYELHATTAGQFQTIPTHAFSFYFPDLYGRSDGTLFTVDPISAESF